MMSNGFVIVADYIDTDEEYQPLEIVVRDDEPDEAGNSCIRIDFDNLSRPVSLNWQQASALIEALQEIRDRYDFSDDQRDGASSG